MKLNTYVVDKIISKISTCTPFTIVLLATVLSLILSIFLMYVGLSIVGEKFTQLFFWLSVFMPVLMTPVIVSVIIILTKHLKYFKDQLEIEIEKNKQKDIMLFEQARFALMGEMISNISHQWKQPLNTIGLATVNARMANLENKTLEKDFDIIEDNINYLATTINDFMSFFDKKTHLETKDLSAIVKEIRSIIDVHMQNKNIKLDIVVDESCCEAAVSSSISQVLLNLLGNSKDAFDDVKLTEKKITLTFLAMEDNLEIYCCDNGKGIDIDIKDKVFDPYFTTKVKTQGTGIGLYMSKQIVQKIFAGEIDVSLSCRLHVNDNSYHTCFNIALPYSDKCVQKKKIK